MLKRVTISAPVGTLLLLATREGWEAEGDGVFVVDDPLWRHDLDNCFGGGLVLSEENLDETNPNGPDPSPLE